MPSNTPRTSRRLQLGVGLIEVLVAVLVVGLGAVAMAKFQGDLLKGGNSAKSRAIAGQLARQKLDDLRTFSQLPTGGATDIYGFDEIATNGGGAKFDDGTLRLPNSTVTVSNTDYGRSWTAQGYYYCGPSAAPQAANCAVPLNKVRPDYFAVAVNIAWTDPEGPQALTLTDAINSIDPLSGALSLVIGTSGMGPIVTYRPGVAPQVIAIDIGGGQKQETTNPTPEVNRKGNQVINTIARYQAIRFGGANATISREEFTTLNCSCTQQGVGPAVNLQGQQVNKRYGIPSDRDQAVECAVCCRDHHDDSSCNIGTSTGRNNCYDPFRPGNDFGASPDHNHYNANGQLANNTGNVYRETCRLRRVDGLQRVAQDWRQIALGTIPQAYFAPNGTPSPAAVADYGTYVRNVVRAALTGAAAPTPPWPTSVEVQRGSSTALNSRGIYLDYLDDGARADYAARISANDPTVFQEIPFYEINLTKLARWAVVNSSIAGVTNDALVNEAPGQNLYSRGVATALAFGTTQITSRSTLSNAGIISQFITPDPDDGATEAISPITFIVPGNNPVISGTVSFPVGLPVGIVTFDVSNGGGPCSFTALTSFYTCGVPANWSGTITPSLPGFTFDPAQRAYSNVVASVAAQNYRAIVIPSGPTISGTITPALPAVAFAATDPASCSYTSNDGKYVCQVPLGWSGTITPSASGYNFTPPARSYPSVLLSQFGQDFTAIATAVTFTITGNVSPFIAGTTVTATGTSGSASFGCTAPTATTPYSCTLPAGWTGNVAPTATEQLFSPVFRSYVGLSLNQVNQNFDTLFTITGTATQQSDGMPITGATVTFSASGSPNTNVSCDGYDSVTGRYRCIVPNGWTGSVTPSASGVTFSPASRQYSNVSSNEITQNYVASSGNTATRTISGFVTGITNSLVVVRGTTGATCSPSTPTAPLLGQVAYSCSVVNGATVTITPESSNNGNRVTFSPASRTFPNVTNNQLLQNFGCANRNNANNNNGC